MFKSLVIILAVFFFTQGEVCAKAFNLSELGASAHTIGLANVEGFVYDATAVFENPASMVFVERHSVSAFTSKLLGKVTYMNYAFARESELGYWGVGYMATEVPGNHITSLSNENEVVSDSTKTYRNFLAKIAYAYPFSDTFSIGLAVDYYSNDILTHTANLWNLDLGSYWNIGGVDISAIAKNILTDSKAAYNYTQEEQTSYGIYKFSVPQAVEVVPFELILGAKMSTGEFDLFAQLKKKQFEPVMAKSFSVKYTPSFFKYIYIMGGSKDYFVVNSIDSTYTLGIGLNVFDFSFNYAYEHGDSLVADNHSFYSFSFNW